MSLNDIMKNGFYGVLMKFNFYALIVCIFILSFNLFSQEVNELENITTLVWGDYIFRVNETQNIEKGDSNEFIEFMIQRDNYPLVNRLVRFISLTPKYFSFEGDTNTIVIATDENGIAKAPIIAKDQGNGIVAIHMLYVNSQGNTNISYETFADVVINEAYSLSSNILPSLVFIYALLAPIVLLLISYFLKIKKSVYSALTMKILFGLPSIKKDFKAMSIITLLITLIVALKLFFAMDYLPLILSITCVICFTLNDTRPYSIIFILLSILLQLDLTYDIIANFLPLEELNSNVETSILTNYIFVFFLFLVITAFLSSIYIPISLLIVYKYMFTLSPIALLLGLIAIFIGAIFYIIQYKFTSNKKLFVFYLIDLLKLGE